MTTDPAVPAAAPEPGHYGIDPERSRVTFATRHLFGLGRVKGSLAVRGGRADIADRIAAGDQALTGTLTVRGITRPVTLTVTSCEVSRGSFSARATTRIDRTEFAITAARGLAARRLDLTVEVQCARI
jgi:polyisoprenoid-binding protein YceI